MTIIEHIRAGKPVTTQGGREVVIYTTEGRQTGFPVIGEHRNSRGQWWLCSWTADGLPVSGISEMALTPAPARTVYVNVYANDYAGEYLIGPFNSPDEARSYSKNTDVSVDLTAAAVPLTFRPGQGIEGRTP